MLHSVICVWTGSSLRRNFAASIKQINYELQKLRKQRTPCISHRPRLYGNEPRLRCARRTPGNGGAAGKGGGVGLRLLRYRRGVWHARQSARQRGTAWQCPETLPQQGGHRHEIRHPLRQGKRARALSAATRFASRNHTPVGGRLAPPLADGLHRPILPAPPRPECANRRRGGNREHRRRTSAAPTRYAHYQPCKTAIR